MARRGSDEYILQRNADECIEKQIGLSLDYSVKDGNRWKRVSPKSNLNLDYAYRCKIKIYIKRKTGIGRLRARGRKSVFNAIFLKAAGWNILRASQSKKMKTKIAKIVKKRTENENASVNLCAVSCLMSSQNACAVLFQKIIPLEITFQVNRLAA